MCVPFFPLTIIEGHALIDLTTHVQGFSIAQQISAEGLSSHILHRVKSIDILMEYIKYV